jgi:predicted  nucleic acid-binding Zn-ribbon protein
MNAVLQTLLKLQALEFADSAAAAATPELEALRTQIPAQVLGHYDRLRARGKKGVAVVRNHVCTGCYMKQPIGKITILMRDEDIQLCDSCGRYLHLPAETAAPAVEQSESTKPVGTDSAAPAKPARKTTRKRKPVLAA